MIWILTVAQLSQLAMLWTERPVFALRGLCETFSLQYPNDMRAAEGEALLRSALRAHGYQLVDRGRTLVIDRAPGRTSGSLPCRAEFSNMRTKLIRVRDGGLDEARRNTASLLSEDGTMDVLWNSNALVVSDHGEVIRELEGWIGD